MNVVKSDENTMRYAVISAISLGRLVHDAATSLWASHGACPDDRIINLVEVLAKRNPLNSSIEELLPRFEKYVTDELESELLGHEDRLVESNTGEDGPTYRWSQRPVYSERGEDLSALRLQLSEFVKARAAALDEIAADEVIVREKAQCASALERGAEDRL